MGKTNGRLEAARAAYREALEAARANPSSEAWAKLLAEGKELSEVSEPKARAKRARRSAVPTIQELEGPVRREPELGELEME